MRAACGLLAVVTVWRRRK
ncbi:hypothetical protein [Ottowia sp. SB7-C50]